MKKNCLSVVALLFSSLNAMHNDVVNDWCKELREEISMKSTGTIASHENNWRDLLDDKIITNAEERGHIFRHSLFSTFATESGEPLCTGIEIHPNALKEDNIELFNFILANKIPIENSYESLMKLAIKKNSIKILHLFDKHNFFDSSLHDDLLFQAIKRNRIRVVKFFLDVLKWPVNKEDFRFLATATEPEMIQLLEGRKFYGEPGERDERRLIKRITRSRRVSSIHLSDVPSTIEGTQEEFYTISDLFDAIQSDDRDKIQKILKLRHFDNLNEVNEWGETIITWAIQKNGNPRIIDILAQYGANLELTNDQGCTPLMLAVRLNNISLVTALLRLDVSRDTLCKESPGDSLVTPLIYAIKNGYSEIAWILAQDKKTNVNCVDSHQQGALLYALDANEEELATLLLEHSVFANKCRALIWAIQRDNTSMVKKLLRLKADPNYSKDDYTALDFAIKHGNYDIAKALLHSGLIVEENISRALKVAVLEHFWDIDIIELLLEHHANPDALCKGSLTLLMYAAKKNYGPIVELLLSYNANPHLIDENRRTALMHAARKGNGEIVIRLLRNIKEDRISGLLGLTKPGTNFVDSEGNNALTHASFAYDPLSVDKLLRWGGNWKNVNKKKETPLLVLAKINERQICCHIAHACKLYIAQSKQVSSISFPDISSGKGKEKESESRDIALAVSTINNESDQDIDSAHAILEELKEINITNTHPLIELSSSLEAKIKLLSGQKKEKYEKVFRFLVKLIENETEMISQCCKLILENNSQALKHKDSKGCGPVMHAINNYNIGALRAFVPYLSNKKLQEAKILAHKKGNEQIEAILNQKGERCLLS